MAINAKINFWFRNISNPDYSDWDKYLDEVKFHVLSSVRSFKYFSLKSHVSLTHVANI